MQNSADKSSSEEAREEQNLQLEEPIFFSISLKKLIILNSLFFGMYAMFWMFKNWKYLKEKQNVKCLPAARALFAPLYFFSLGPRMIKIIKENGGKAPPLPFIVLGLIYVFGNFIGRFHHPACIFLCLLNVVPLVLLQRGVNEINGGPEAVINKKFSRVNRVFMVICAILWGLVIFSKFVET